MSRELAAVAVASKEGSEPEWMLECGASLAEGEFATTTTTATKIVEKSAATATTSTTRTMKHASMEELRAWISGDVGTSVRIDTPFEKATLGGIPLIYCDHTASNRPCRSLEQYIGKTCLAWYANTHTNTSTTGSQSTAFVAEARQIVAEHVNAKITGKASLDVVLFAGNGATSSVELLIDCMGLRHATNNNNNNNKQQLQPQERPIVFVGPYEHHSNLVPWRESGVQVVMVPECPVKKQVDMKALERLLQQFRNAAVLKMGTFSAASNVTGKLSDVKAITALLHRYNALAFFDYATAAPYSDARFMNMNPPPCALYEDPGQIAADAMFLSPHKMVGGGAGTPGVLIVKKHLVSQVNAPHRAGGGTVFYVTEHHHRFLSNRVERYEGGTRHIVGIWRVGLCFLWKRYVEQQYQRLAAQQQQQQQLATTTATTTTTTTTNHSTEGTATTSIPATIFQHDLQTYQTVAAYLKQHAPKLILLGHHDCGGGEGDHLPIFSFLIRFDRHRFLHFNYVCAVLNDLFGIQSRGGCQCAGPYSQRLLGLHHHYHSSENNNNSMNAQVEHALVHYKERAELLRPGYTRLSLPFKGLSAGQVTYVMKVLVWMSEHAWALLCQYRCNHRTGEWRHATRQGKPLGKQRRWLSHYQPHLVGPEDGDDTRTTTTTTIPIHNNNDDNNNNNEKLVDFQDATLLQQTLEQADHVLAAARHDQRSIAQALKMVDADSVLGKSSGDNDDDDGESLENLRWYAYPKECAIRLTRGGGVSSTDQDMDAATWSPRDILGAVNPFLPDEAVATDKDDTNNNNSNNTTKMMELGEVLEEQQPAEEEKSSSSSSETSEKKRKMEEEEDPTPSSVVGEPKTGMVLRTSQNNNNNTVMPFRDGEYHQGEAELWEIEEGIADGELSEHTEVYDNRLGEWASAFQYLSLSSSSSSSNGKKAKTTTTKDGNSISLSEPQQQQLPETTKQTKKAPRDESLWGRGEVTGVLSSSSSFAVTTTTTTTTSQHQLKSQTADMSETTPPAAAAAADDDENSNKSGKKKKKKHVKPPAKLMRFVTQAVFQWDMIQNGDRLLLGLSGGKDSLSLLHCLLELQRKLPMKFVLEVCTIDPMTPSFDPSPLIPYVETLGLKYHYIKDDIVARAASAGKDGKMVTSLCAFCARMKRGNLYNVARQAKCNKLVLAQHLDDCAESFMMSVMHNGFLRTMKANYEINAGDLSVIRPMVYCRESLMTEFAKAAKLPVINENCPACFEEPKERARVKKLLSREELKYANFYDNIKRSLIPLMHPHAEAVMHSFTEETVAKSRQKWTPPENKHNNQNGQESVPTATPTTDDNHNNNNNTDDTPPAHKTTATTTTTVLLSDCTDEDLMAELARRKGARFRLAGAMRSHNPNASEPQPQPQQQQQQQESTTTEADLPPPSKILCEVGGACSLFD